MVSLNSTSDASRSSTASAESPYVAPQMQVPGRQAIALISDHGDPAAEIGKEEAGAQNVYVRQVGEALAKLGWQVDIFTRKTNPDDPKIVQHSDHCRTIRLKAGPEQFLPRHEVFEYLPEFVEAFLAFQSKGINYPLVHTNYWMSAWIGLQLKQRRNIQLVHTYHSLGAVKYQGISPLPNIAKHRLAVEQNILETADCIVANSPQEVDLLQTFVSQQGHIEMIPAGADTNTFYAIPKAEARAKLNFAPDEAIVLYVGRFDPRKGIDTLIDACAQLKAGGECRHSAVAQTDLDVSKLRLVIVGGGDPDHAYEQEQQRIEQRIQEAGLAEQVSFVGRVGHALLPLYYTAADVCVIPSQYEPFGLVAIEAMACGTPVIASDIGGLRFTIIPEETGLLVPAGDVPAFAQAIHRVLSDEVWAKKLSRQASTRVQQNFSWSGVAACLSDLYRRLLAQSISQLDWTATQPSASTVTPVPLSNTVELPDESLTKAS